MSIKNLLPFFLVLVVLVIISFGCSTNKSPGEERILVFSKTAGFRHASIEDGLAAIQTLGKKNGILVDTTENSENINEDNLKKYQAVIFLNTTGDILDHYQKADFERYIQAGGGFAGIHAAADTEYNWPWYGKLVGAYFESHPNDPNVRDAVVNMVNSSHPSTDSLPEKWPRTDEWYNYKSINPEIQVLLNLDEKSYEGGTNGDHHPIAWNHEYDGGRAFYTGGGHTSESFSDLLFLRHLWGGIQYAMGGKKSLNYKLASTQRIPEDNRFEVTVLDQKLDEPTEMSVLKDGTGRIIFTERKGAVKLYDPATNQSKVIGNFPVHTEFEDGLMGMALDPDFKKNNWIYFYYSPIGDKPVQYLVRVDFDGQRLNMASEKLLLEVGVQRETCCHTGGSIEFDSNGNLYLSTGDDTNPFASNGFGPIDERPGRSSWDAQGSSGNPNDLRGKILRIRPQPDGTFTIPEGNLFAVGEPGSRPEIYTMGNRNPYRISVDPKTNFLYWGEVGPDAGETTERRGTRGYDEINQARKAGFFGWPYFVGDNQPYRDFNFQDSTSGDYFNPEGVINNSPNNTGRQNLPPAQKAFIWYPYAESPEFPMLGKGGRTAMAGPVYYSDLYKKTDQKFPDYFDGKLFIYEWVRGWIKFVTMDHQGDIVKIEPFMPDLKLSKPIDMEFGPDGALYILEYGDTWFAQNDDSRIIKIEFNPGNRKPVVQLAANQTAGAAPLTVGFSSTGSFDHDKDQISYKWYFTDHDSDQSSEPNPEFTFSKPGIYNTVLTVTDAMGASSSQELEIKVGNEKPVVAFEVKGNKSFYNESNTLPYSVVVSDKEDGDLKSGKIAKEDVFVTINYLPEGADLTVIAQGHQSSASTGFIAGKRLIDESDCKACHQADKRSIGPSYLEVAKKYKGERDVIKKLAQKIINGGGGVWGEQAMAAHPQVSEEDASEMVKYIISLANEKKTPGLPVSGSFALKEHQSKGGQGSYIIRAAYSDKGAHGIGPITSQEILLLRNPKVKAIDADESHRILKVENPEGGEFPLINDGGYLSYKNIDLSYISKITFKLISEEEGSTIELRTGSPDGQLIGKSEVASKGGPVEVTTQLKPQEGYHDLYVVVKNEGQKRKPLFKIDWLHFQQISKKAI
ncbi:hypothetical protein BH23BAC1_BH23BAC1_15830 [soil metagenome]